MKRFKMRLNVDLYSDLAKEFIPSLDDDVECVNKFVFSGRESFIGLRRSISKIKSVLFGYLVDFDDSDSPQYSFAIKVKFDDDTMIDIDLENPFMEYITRWILSSTKRIKIDIKDPLPDSVMDLLLKNPNFTQLQLYMYDPPAAKQLISSKKFDYIQAGALIFGNFEDVHIDTKELRLRGVSLGKILKAEHIKVNSLITSYSEERFTDSLLAMDINSNFESLEKLELEIINRNTYFDVQKILKFLEFLNTKFINLKILSIDFNEFRELFYDRDQEAFNMLPNSFKEIIGFEDELSTYDGRTKVKINHNVTFSVLSTPKEMVETFYEDLKNELRGFGYFVYIQDNMKIYNFKRFRKIVENMEMNSLVRLSHYG